MLNEEEIESVHRCCMDMLQAVESFAGQIRRELDSGRSDLIGPRWMAILSGISAPGEEVWNFFQQLVRRGATFCWPDESHDMYSGPLSAHEFVSQYLSKKMFDAFGSSDDAYRFTKLVYDLDLRRRLTQERHLLATPGLIPQVSPVAPLTLPDPRGLPEQSSDFTDLHRRGDWCIAFGMTADQWEDRTANWIEQGIMCTCERRKVKGPVRFKKEWLQQNNFSVPSGNREH